MKDETRRFLAERMSGRVSTPDGPSEWPAPAGSFGEVLQDAWIEAAQVMDPMASHASVLEVRLWGPELEAGEIALERAEALFPLLRKEVQSASPKPSQARLALAGIRMGSVILELRPPEHVAAEADGQFESPISVVDPAVRKVLQLHSLLGREGVTPAELASAFSQPLLNATARLITALSDWRAEMSMAWHPPTGRAVRAALDEGAQRRALEFFAEEPEEKLVLVQGLLVEMSLAGHVVVKPSIQGKQQRVQIDADRLQQLGWTLGETVYMRALRRVERDKVGREGRERFEFRDVLPGPETFQN